MPAWDVRRFASIDSTNSWVMAEARRGAAEGLVAVAGHQSAGRGRLGRTWDSPAGSNLLCTVLLRPEASPQLAVARVSLAARDAARTVAGADARLKWPNDLVVDDRKLAGVLAESEAGAVAVGIGMNVGWAPAGSARLGEGISPDVVLAAVLQSLGGWCAQDDTVVAGAYRKGCVTVGRTVRVQLMDEVFTGVAADIDAAGHLLVDVGMCLRTVSAGDIVHLR